MRGLDLFLVITMGTVAVTFRLMPESADTDLNGIKDGVKKKVASHNEMTLKTMEEKPIAFGLKSLDILIIMPDGSIGDLETDLGRIKGVASVEAGNVTLI